MRHAEPPVDRGLSASVICVPHKKFLTAFRGDPDYPRHAWPADERGIYSGHRALPSISDIARISCRRHLSYKNVVWSSLIFETITPRYFKIIWPSAVVDAVHP